MIRGIAFDLTAGVSHSLDLVSLYSVYSVHSGGGGPERVELKVDFEQGSGSNPMMEAMMKVGDYDLADDIWHQS